MESGLEVLGVGYERLALTWAGGRITEVGQTDGAVEGPSGWVCLEPYSLQHAGLTEPDFGSGLVWILFLLVHCLRDDHLSLPGEDIQLPIMLGHAHWGEDQERLGNMETGLAAKDSMQNKRTRGLFLFFSLRAVKDL